MDPVTLSIITAILSGCVAGMATGATSGIAKASEQAIVDGYSALKKLIESKTGKKSNAVQAINDLETNPGSIARRSVVEEELNKVKAGEDIDILNAAKALLTSLNKDPEGQKLVNQVAIGDGNVQLSGDGSSITYNSPPKRS